MRRPALTAMAILTVACAPSPRPQYGAILSPRPTVPVDTLSAAARGLPPCAAAQSPGADWREVAGPGFSFCIPSDWRPSTKRDSLAAQSGAWRGRSGEFLRWAIGPFREGPRKPLPMNEERHESAVIGGRQTNITLLYLPESYTYFARWEKSATMPVLFLDGYARDDAHRALVRRIIGTVRFGDAAPTSAPALRADVVVPAFDTMTVAHLAGGRTDTVAFFVQTFRPTTYRAREAWEQVFTWHGRDGSSSVDTMYFSRDSLVPLAQLRHNARQDVAVTYEGSRVHIVDHAKIGLGSVSVTDTTLAVAPFSSAQFDVVVRALPLAAGYQTRVPFYYVGNIGLRSTPVRVVGEERIRVSDGSEVDCWIVELEGVGVRSRFWIAKDTRLFYRLVDTGDPSGEWTFTR